MINDFESQKVFWDRRKIFELLQQHNIPTPVHICVDRGEEINNDGEVNQIDTNSNEEIINMINKYSSKLNTKDTSKSLVKLNLDSDSKKNLQEISTGSLVSLEENYNNIWMPMKNNTNKKDLSDHKKYSVSNNTNLNDLDYFEITNQTSKDDQIYLSENSNPYGLEVDKDLIEYDDHIEYKGQKLNKPFIEKPFNGDDHNIYIYYPPNLGGGHKRLFRKTKNLCSLYIPNEGNIRRDKSYIYEEFLQTDGFDIKVYTIGDQYAHAEARKSPCLDGIVRRSREGKEVRYPVNLTPSEKELARKIVNIFKQNICGFDILRSSQGNSYVCDVNGWSFVKGNRKYYEDCAILIRKMILLHINPLKYAFKPLNLKVNIPTYGGLILPHLPEDSRTYDEELRSVVAVFRHADRSPKQKMKLVVNHPLILNLFKVFGKQNTSGKIKEIKLKKPKELMRILKIATSILEEHQIDETKIIGLNDVFLNKLLQLKMVLEKNLNFEGMTRKIQLKPLKTITIKDNDGKEIETVTEALFIFKWGGDITHSGIEQAKILGTTFRFQMYPSYSGEEDGLLRLHSTYRHDLKCYSADEGRCLKTTAAFLQGLLQLDGSLIPIISSMVRRDEPVLNLLDVSCDDIADIRSKVKDELSECLNHDGNLIEKFKSNFENNMFNYLDEGHALLDLMKKIDNPFKVMNSIYELIRKYIQHIKSLLTMEELTLDTNSYLIVRHSILQKRKTMESWNIESKHDEIPDDIIREMSNISLPVSEENSESIEDVNKRYECEDEKIILIYKRWIKLYQDFYKSKDGQFDVSKIPDIYDNIKYDIIHNKSLMNEDAHELFNKINLLANFVMPLEYGITTDEKVHIGLKVIGPLLNKIHNDLLWWFYPTKGTFYNENEYVKLFENENESYSGLDRHRLNKNDIKSAWRHIKTRFYFTCASHLYSLINTIIFGLDSYLIDQTESNQKFIKELKNVLDLDYCSHIIFRLYENFNYEFV